MKINITLIYYTLLITVFSSFVYVLNAQSGGRILGRVTDTVTGESLVNVNIILYADSTGREYIAGSATNLQGNYTFTSLHQGVFYLVASYIGYQSKTEKIVIPSPNRSVEFNFTLRKKQVELDQVLIEARRDTHKTISTIDISPEFIKQLPSISGETDVYRALTLLPGVATSSELSSGLYVRGGSPDQTLTLIDGVVVYNPFHLGGFASTFNSDAIKDIRLIKGAFPAQYGGRLSSVLDITLREGSRERFQGIGGIGLISSRLTLEGPISDKLTYIISGRRMYIDLLQEQFKENTLIPHYNFFDVNGKFVFRASEIDRITLSGFHGKDFLYNPPASKDVAYDINWGNSTLNLNWLRLTEEKKFTSVSLNYTGYSFQTIITDKNPDAFKQDFYSTSSIEDFTVRIDGQYFSTDKHTVKNGIEVILHNFNLVNNNFFVPILTDDERIGTDISSIETAAYIQDEWQITPLWFMNVGGRFYYFPRARYFQFEPRISTVYALTDKFFIKGAFSIANQFLHLIVRNDVVLPTDIWFPSTPLIKPGRSVQYVAGFEAEMFNREYLFSVEGYFKNMTNLYEYSDTATFTFEAPIEEQFSEGRGDAYGIEFFLNKRKGKLTGWIGYTLAWTKRYFDAINNGKPFFPRYDRRHDVSVVLSYALNEHWEFGATWVYGTGQAYTMPTGQYFYPPIYSNPHGGNQIFLDYTEINSYRLPPFHKMDISATYKFMLMNSKSELSLSVYNVYNRLNPFARYVNYEVDNETGGLKPLLKQFTLFPVFPTLSFMIHF